MQTAKLDLSMKIYEFMAEGIDFKMHDFLPASNKKQAIKKVKVTIAKMGYQKPTYLNLIALSDTK
ncbi:MULTISPECIES: hypothetical protein [Emticicia]|uniref:hypothetical protein n=1 Tax=Emticicia TaxID=312278 RepID=UPI000C778A62|nr:MULTISPECIES: hypothetical protein [Emticicia]PLK45392.1 hypothetical protein C0V77_04410 [Emticicia sp. TH156]UTA69658.1 hypothetical protein MB380_07565 [Emticicia sp. 21SJ11W-3]